MKRSEEDDSGLKKFFLPHLFIRSFKTLWRNEISHLKHGGTGLAVSMGTGVFIGFSPFLGFHTILCALFAKVFKKSFIGAYIGSSIPTGIPWLMPGVYFLSYRLGLFLLGLPYNAAVFEKFKHLKLENAAALIRTFGKPLLLGCTVNGLVGGAITFFVVKYLAEVRKRKHGNK